jgi:hypothetical protein
MRRRTFALLAASVALSACGGDSTLPRDPQLRGAWTSGPVTVQEPNPGGGQTVTEREHLEMGASTFLWTITHTDAAGNTYPYVIWSGTWYTNGQTILFTINQLYARNMAAAGAPAVAEPVNPIQGHSDYAVGGADLQLTPFCAIGVSCIGGQYVHFVNDHPSS